MNKIKKRTKSSTGVRIITKDWKFKESVQPKDLFGDTVWVPTVLFGDDLPMKGFNHIHITWELAAEKIERYLSYRLLDKNTDSEAKNDFPYADSAREKIIAQGIRFRVQSEGHNPK